MITMVALGVSKEGGEEVKAVAEKIEFTSAVLGIMNIIMAYGMFGMLHIYESNLR